MTTRKYYNEFSIIVFAPLPPMLHFLSEKVLIIMLMYTKRANSYFTVADRNCIVAYFRQE